MSGGAASPIHLSGSSSASSGGSIGSSALVSVDFGRRAISVDAPEGGGPLRAEVGAWPADDGRAAREGSAVPMDAAAMAPLDTAATLAGGAAATSSVASGNREILDAPVVIDGDAASSIGSVLGGILEIRAP